MNQKTINNFARMLRTTAQESVAASSPAEVVELTLTSTNPIQWQKGVRLPLPEGVVIVPKGMGFDPDDVGRIFLFLKAQKGSRFFFLCERGDQ